MIIDATDLIVGRIATIAAKKALLGEKIDIINCEKAVMTGRSDSIIEKFKKKVKRGIPAQGPFTHRKPDRIVRRIIRGMLPYRQHKGREAFKRVMCYIGVPEDLKGKKAETIKEADISKITYLKYLTIEEISELLIRK